MAKQKHRKPEVPLQILIDEGIRIAVDQAKEYINFLEDVDGLDRDDGRGEDDWGPYRPYYPIYVDPWGPYDWGDLMV